MSLLPVVTGIWMMGSLTAAPPAARPEFIYTEAARFDARATERFPAGARLMVWTRGAAHPLLPAFAASADAALSFDATRVLFAGKRTTRDPWRIWEIALAGGAPRAITSGDGDCIRPHYLPLQKLTYARRTTQGLHIETASISGGPPLRLTYGVGDYLPAAILRDGRILTETSDLLTLYSDGSGVESYRCDHGPVRFAATQLTSGDIIFQLAAGLGRFTSARAVQLPVALPNGEYFGPVAEFNGRWLLSCRPGPGAPVSLCAVTPGTEQPPVIVVRGSEGAGAWQPAVVVPRPAPPFHPSSLGESDGANLLCLDAYASKAGRLPAGSIAAVRLWLRDAAGQPVLAGSAPAAGDGSFYVRVPGDQPIRFDLVDTAGRVLRAERHWFWTRKGEQRVCTGCHVGPERAPANLAPEILDKTQAPVPLGLNVSTGGR